MALTAAQLDQMHAAILAAYDRDELNRMLRSRMDVVLANVVAAKPFADEVYDLVTWADRAGRAVELAQCAAADKPRHAGLQALQADARTWDPTPAGAGSPAAQQTGQTTIVAQVSASQNVAIGTNIHQEVHYHAAAAGPLWSNVPPRPTEPLLGRDDLLADLVARLSAGNSPAVAIDGLPGVGKTALTVALAHDDRIRTRFSGGVLWGGLGMQPDAITVQNQWAAALGIDLGDLPAVQPRTQRLSAAVGDRRVLVVLDDAWDADTPMSLRLSSPAAVHLLTTRDRTVARAFAGAAQQVHIPELDADAAFVLLQRLAPEACAADPAAARALVAAVGALPLAIAVLGGYLAGHDLTIFPDLAPEAFAALGDPRQRLALAAARLGGQPGRLETLETTIRLSVDALEQVNPPAAAAFWALGAFAPKPASFDRAAAQAVTGADSRTLATLALRNLVETADGGLAVHQMVHDVMAVGVPPAAQAAHAGHYAAVLATERRTQRYRAVLPALAQVRMALHWAIAHDIELALAIAGDSAGLQAQFNLVWEAVEWAQWILDAAQGTGAVPATVADAWLNLAQRLTELANLPGVPRGQCLQDALAACDQAVALTGETGDLRQQAGIHNVRGGVLRALATVTGESRRMRLAEALTAYDDALRCISSARSSLLYAATQNSRALCLTDLANLPGEDRRPHLYAALAAYDEVLQVVDASQAPMDFASTQSNRAILLRELAALPDEDRPRRLYAALAACDDALRCVHPDDAPLDYAQTQNIRALVLGDLATVAGESPRARLDAAIVAAQDALNLQPLDSAPLAYAGTQGNLAIFYTHLADLAGEDQHERQRQAVQAAATALWVFGNMGHGVYAPRAQQQLLDLQARFGAATFAELWAASDLGPLPRWLAAQAPQPDLWPQLPDDLRQRLLDAGGSDGADLAAALAHDPDLRLAFDAWLATQEPQTVTTVNLAIMLSAFRATRDVAELVTFWNTSPLAFRAPFLEHVEEQIEAAAQDGDALTVEQLRQRLNTLYRLLADATAGEQAESGQG